VGVTLCVYVCTINK